MGLQDWKSDTGEVCEMASSKIKLKHSKAQFVATVFHNLTQLLQTAFNIHVTETCRPNSCWEAWRCLTLRSDRLCDHNRHPDLAPNCSCCLYTLRKQNKSN